MKKTLMLIIFTLALALVGFSLAVFVDAAVPQAKQAQVSCSFVLQRDVTVHHGRRMQPMPVDALKPGHPNGPDAFTPLSAGSALCQVDDVPGLHPATLAYCPTPGETHP